MPQRRGGKGGDVGEKRGAPPMQERAGLRRGDQRLTGTRAGPPDERLVAIAGAKRANQGKDSVQDVLRQGHVAQESLNLDQVLRGRDEGGNMIARAGRHHQHGPLVVLRRKIDVELHQEPVELRLRQRIGAILFDGILRGQNVKGSRQTARRPGRRDLPLLHRLQQCGLRAGAGAVDLVGHEKLRKDRALDEAELPAAVLRVLENLGAEDVGRNQIRRELHARGVEPQDSACRLHEPRLGKSRQADEKRVAAGKQRHQHLLDDFVLPDHGSGELVLRLLKFSGQGIEAGNGVTGAGGRVYTVHTDTDLTSYDCGARGPLSIGWRIMNKSPSLADIESLLAGERRPPVESWHPEREARMDLCIAADGRWIHEGGVIEREALVRLFASILRREGERYFLVTPVEKLEIDVEDAPFQAVETIIEGEGKGRRIALRTNVGDHVIVDAAHPLHVRERGGEPAPYVEVRAGLEARIGRAVWYELADLAIAEDADPPGLWSSGTFFSLSAEEA